MRPFWLIFFGMGCLLLRVGIGLQAVGSVRAKNASAAIARSIAEAAAAAIAFWIVGAAILFQSKNGWFAIDLKLLFREPGDYACDEFFHMTVCLIGGAIVTGALAERSQFYVGVIVSALMGGLVIPLFGHWAWFGQLHAWNFIDFGGAAAVHLSAAIFGAVGIAVMGSRAGKYAKDGTSISIEGHSLPAIGIGVVLLFVGWFPYLLGCVASHWPRDGAGASDIDFGIAATNILLAGTSGVIGALILSHYEYRKPDYFFICNGLLGALVAISAGVIAVDSVSAALIGLVAGIIVPAVSIRLDTKVRLDDPIGLVAVHGVGAVWGVLAIAFFVPTRSLIDHLRLLAIQSGGLALIIVVAFLIATLLFTALKALGRLRIDPADESAGLDLSDHGVASYPEFGDRNV